jgi:serine/threonine-protein kinase TTK/MPS1
MQQPLLPVQQPSGDFLVQGRQYHRLAVIGRGGTSKVFKVMDSSTRDIYALKRVIFEGQDEAFRANVRNEIELLRSLQSVETIIQLVAAQVDEAAQTAYIVMEMGEIDLASLLQRQQGKPFNHNFVGMYWQQMLSAVHELHERRVVHSDLKPANFLSVQVRPLPLHSLHS